jgi:mono/diheme cytochrome c family protein
VLLALSGGQKAGILVMAAIFIGFALASSLYFPRRDPDFPGSRGLRGFIAITIVLFIAMMGAIVLLAKEDEAEGGHEEAVATETTPGDTQAEPPTDTEPPAGDTEPAAAGDPAAGEQVFASAGCGGCHTLQAAGAAGTIGPNLDQAKPDHDLVVDRVTNGKGVMPSFKGQLSEDDIENVAAYVVASTQG